MGNLEPVAFSQMGGAQEWQSLIESDSHPLHPSVPPVYEELRVCVCAGCGREHYPPGQGEEIPDHEQFLEGLKRLLRWVWKEGKTTPSGGLVRAGVLAWMVDPGSIGNPTQVELAAMLGVGHKQTIGREVSDFRERFRYFNRMMRRPEAIAVFKRREATKRAARKGKTPAKGGTPNGRLGATKE